MGGNHGDPDLAIVTYTFEPASPTEQALAFLASWSTQGISAEPAEQPGQAEKT